MTAAAAAGGAVAGAALGRLSLLAGLGAIVYGTMKNNQHLTTAGIAATVVPGALSSTEKSQAGGIKAYIEDAQTSVKKLAANVLPKTGINIVFPNAFPSLALGSVDADYYGGGQSAIAAEQAFQRALMSGVDDEEYQDMGRTLEAGYQTMEVSGNMGDIGEVSGLEGFAETAEKVSANW